MGANFLPASESDEFKEMPPADVLKSNIVSYEDFCKVWSKLPQLVRLGTPKRIFNSSKHGFYPHVMLAKLEKRKEDYKYTLMFFRLNDKSVYGFFLDDHLKLELKDYQG